MVWMVNDDNDSLMLALAIKLHQRLRNFFRRLHIITIARPGLSRTQMKQEVMIDLHGLKYLLMTFIIRNAICIGLQYNVLLQSFATS